MSLRRIVLFVLMLVCGAWAYNLSVTARTANFNSLFAPTVPMIIAWIATVVLAGLLVMDLKGFSLTSVVDNYTTRDLVMMAVLIIVGGIIKAFWGQGRVFVEATTGPYGASIYGGGFVLWGVLANHVIRKPLVGTSTMVLGGIVEILAGNPFGLPVLLFNAWEGFGPDLAYMLFGQRRYDLFVAVLGGIFSSIIGLAYGWVYFGMGQLTPGAGLAFVLSSLVGGILGGVLGYAIGQALERFGVRRQTAAVIEN